MVIKKMVSKGNYVCDICHKYIRPKRNGKKTGQIIIKHLLKIWKDLKTGSYKTYYTKAHKKCFDKLKEGDKRK